MRFWPWSRNVGYDKIAIFRQLNQDCPTRHHDALEFPDGQMVLLTFLKEGQEATVLQLPATEIESKARHQATYLGFSVGLAKP